MRARVLRAAGGAAILAAAGVGLSVALASGRSRPAPEAGRKPLFTDITAGAGIRFEFRRKPVNIRATVGPGVAMADFDGDGRLDLFFVGQSRATPRGAGALYRNLGGNRFEDVTAASGLGVGGYWMGAAVADVNADSRPDLLLTGYGDTRLFVNRGDCRFQDATRVSGLEPASPTAWASSAAFADVNRDGFLDAAVGRYLHFTEEIARGVKDKWWSPGNFEAQKPSLYLGGASGRFREVTREWGLAAATGKTLGVAFADANGDGYPDLYLANDEVAGDLFLNQAGKRFANRGVPSGTAYTYNGKTQAGMGADWGDFSGDGRLDLVVTTFEREPMSLYENDGGGFFTHASARAGIFQPSLPYVGWGVKFLDYDGDGLLDLATVNGHVRPDSEKTGSDLPFEQEPNLYRGAGDGRFEMVRPPTGPPLGPALAGRGLAAGDIDNDGDTDLVIASMSGPPRLLRNDAPATGRWLGIELRGARGNTGALGARVTVTAGGRTQTREVGTGGSFLSASDPRLLFGLGTAPGAESVEIRWPGGAVQRLPAPAPGQYHVYVEPDPDPPGR